MSDDFLRKAQADWRAQEAGVDQMLRRLRRSRWMPHMLMGLDIVAGALLAVAGVWFAWIAWSAERHQLLFVLSAAMLLASAPLMAVVSVLSRRSALHWEDETPERILRVGVQRADASLKALRASRWQIVLLFAFVAVLWIVEAAGLLQAFDFLLFYTPVCIAWAILWRLWSGWRLTRLARERAAYVRLLAEFDADGSQKRL